MVSFGGLDIMNKNEPKPIVDDLLLTSVIMLFLLVFFGPYIDFEGMQTGATVIGFYLALFALITLLFILIIKDFIKDVF